MWQRDINPLWTGRPRLGAQGDLCRKSSRLPAGSTSGHLASRRKLCRTELSVRRPPRLEGARCHGMRGGAVYGPGRIKLLASLDNLSPRRDVRLRSRVQKLGTPRAHRDRSLRVGSLIHSNHPGLCCFLLVSGLLVSVLLVSGVSLCAAPCLLSQIAKYVQDGGANDQTSASAGAEQPIRPS